MKMSQSVFRAGTLIACAMLFCAALPPFARAADDHLRFRDDGSGSFVFDTGIVKGAIGKDGTNEALKPVTFIPGNVQIVQNHGLLCPYRFLTPEKRYGFGSWEWPRTGKLLPDGSVELHWAATADRPYAFTTHYTWKAADTLDFTVVFTPETDLHHFELFLGSYFLNFKDALALAKNPDGGATFVHAAHDKGGYQYFPRDSSVMELLNDGRWKFPPYPIDWSIRQEMAAPVAVRRERQSGVTVLIMSLPDDCAGVSMMRQDWGGGSTYLSLFGRDMQAGQSYTARARLVFGRNLDDAEALRRYGQYLTDLNMAGKRALPVLAEQQPKPPANANPNPPTSPEQEAAKLKAKRIKALTDALRDFQKYNDRESATFVSGIIETLDKPGGSTPAALANVLQQMKARVRQLIQQGALESAGTLNFAQIQMFVDMNFPSSPPHPNRHAGGAAGPDGLVLYMPFDKPDENGVVRDESGAGNDGRVFGAQWVRDGKFGGAYQFRMTNLEDRIVVPNSDSLNPDFITVCAWVKVSANAPLWRRIADKDFHHGYDLTLSGDRRIEGKPWFETGRGSVGSDRTLDDNQWHHVAGTFDGKTVRCYVDGVEKNHQIRAGKLGKSGWDLCIGNSTVGYGWGEFVSFDGLIDEVRIYNRALSADEIKTLASATAAGK